MELLKKNDKARNARYGIVTILRDASADDQFIPVQFFLNGKLLTNVQLSINSLEKIHP